MMLFLLGLSCLAAKITLITDKGNKFAFNVKPVKYGTIMSSEVENSSVFVLGADGRRLYEGSFAGAGSGAAPQPAVSIVSSPGEASTTIGKTDFTKLDIQTRKWSGEQIEPIQIEIIGTFGPGGCHYCIDAKALADKVFGPDKVEEHNYNDSYYRQRSQEILSAAGMGDYPYIPRISIISIDDGKPVRWFLGGFDDLQNFVNTNKIAPATPQAVRATQTDSKTDFASMDLPTTMWTGAPIQPIQIEIFGADYCPPCQSEKNVVIKNFPNMLKFYDIKKRTPEAATYMKISNSILRTVRSVYTGMPRVSVIYNGNNGPERVFIGGPGAVQKLINSIRNKNAGFK